MTPSGSHLESGDRPTRVGTYSVTQPGTTTKRVIPAPWIDCEHCKWRHYPSTSRGRWHIATLCVSCGGALGGSEA